MDSYEWRCRKHPLHTLAAVCPFCLAHRLRQLCPECASARPCGCPSSSAVSCEIPSTSSSSSSFSSIFDPPAGEGIGVVGRISVLIDSEPAFRRSASARVSAVPYLRSKSRASQPCVVEEESAKPPESRRRWSIWSFFGWEKQRNEEKSLAAKETVEPMKLRRSRSVGVSYFPESFRPKVAVAAEHERAVGEGGRDGKGWSWSFPTPMRVFRHSRAVNGRSPMCRG